MPTPPARSPGSRLALLGALALSGCAGAGEVEVAPAQHHDLSAPLRLMPVAVRGPRLVEHEVKRIPRAFDGRAPSTGPAAGRAAPSLLMPSPLLDFDGMGLGFSGPSGTFSIGSAPPDTDGDVGPNHYLQLVNTDLAVFAKSGTILFGPVPLNTLWSGFGGDCQTNNDGDGVVLHDPIADRWVVSQFSVSGANGGTKPFLQCVAVSQSPDPTGAWYRYSFAYTGFNDYPKMGVWPDAYYVTFNMFNAAGTTFAGSKVCAYDRARMLGGAAATQQCFNAGAAYGGLLPADLDGARLPPAGAPNPLVALGPAASTLAVWQFHVDWASPASSTFTGPLTLATAPFSEACGAGGVCIPQSGGGSLDAISDRLMFRLAYRRFADGHQALVVNHTVTAGSSSGVRWYELRLDAAGTPSIFQQGDYAPDANHRWMGSMAQDQAGNLALGFSLSSSALKPSIRYTGRLAGDPPGQMPQGEGTLVTGAGAQGSSLNRWGDYSMMGVDPADDCTFWFTSEYIPADGTFNWKTRIGSFRFPGCGAGDFTIGSSPATLSIVQGAAGSSTISTAAVAGSGTVTLSASVSPPAAGVTASLSPPSLAAGASALLTVAASAAAAPGTYTVTVAGLEGATSHATSIDVTVVAAPDFTVSAAPATLSVLQGGQATSAVSTAVAAGGPAAVGLSAAVSPATPLLTAVLSPATVTAGGGSLLTVAASASALPGDYLVTVTGVEGSFTHATSLVATVVAAPDFALGAAPASLTIPQGGTGSSTIGSAAIAGGPGTVSLAAAVSPAGPDVGAALSPASVTAGGSAQLTVGVSASAAPGRYRVAITGTEGIFVHGVEVTVDVVPAPDFAFPSAPRAISIEQGRSGSTDVLTAVAAGAAGPVALSAAVAPASAELQATVVPGTVLAGQGATLTVSASASAAPGSYSVTVTGLEGDFTHGVEVALTVAPAPDFVLSAAPSAVSMVPGGSATSAVSSAVAAGAAGPLALSASVSPPTSGVSASVLPGSLLAGEGAILSVNASPQTAPGTYTVTVTGTEGSFSHQAEVTATVLPAPDFAISAAPAALSVPPGAQESAAISTAVAAGATDAVALAVEVTPAGGGVNAAVSPQVVAAGGGATLTVSAAANAAPGSYAVVVRGTEGSFAHAAAVAVTVPVPARVAPAGGGGCGCAPGAGSPAAALPFGLLLLALRRRRPSRAEIPLG